MKLNSFIIMTKFRTLTKIDLIRNRPVDDYYTEINVLSRPNYIVEVAIFQSVHSTNFSLGVLYEHVSG